MPSKSFQIFFTGNALALPYPFVEYSGLSMDFSFYRCLLIFSISISITASCLGVDVRLTNGQVYRNVTIVSNDGQDVEFRLGYQKIKIPAKTVAKIEEGAAAIPNPAHANPVPPPALPPSTGVTSGEPTPAPVPASTPVFSEPTPSASDTAAPVAASTPTFAPTSSQSTNTATVRMVSSPDPTSDTPQVWPTYAPRWNMDLLLALFAGISAVWLGTVSKVQGDLFKRRADPRFWTNVSVLLPGVGSGFYFFVRGIAGIFERRKAAKDAPSVNAQVAEREKATETRRKRKGFEFLDEERKSIEIKNSGSLSGIETAQDVLEEALLERASDVHIEPSEEIYGVRFRIDGVLQFRMSFSRDEGQRMVSALKTLAQIDVAEKRKAQDGRFRVRKGEEDVDFRVATANSIFGEKLVIRILNRKMGLLGLNDLGMSQEMMDQFARVIHSRSGMIVVTGPTGSGKTSTLYSALSQIDAVHMNVVTIEDPVEYELPGATQMPVNVKAGVTYESGLRSLLRQDPDVILVGEMRDTEAAQIALRAALTGHLLFTSLHTKNAIGTLVRLEEMGIERHQLASALLVVVAQRLVRVLCPACREAYEGKGDELKDIGIELPEGAALYLPKGCPECRDTGYIGRTGIFEMIVFDDELRQAIIAGAGEQELTTFAEAKGYRSYRVDGAEKVLLGITTVEEVLQAT